MSMVVVGELRDVTERVAGREPNQWTETVLWVLDGRTVTQLTVAEGKSFTFRGEQPTQADVGQVVALEVGVRAYSTKNGEARYALTAFGRSSKIERALSADVELARV